MSNLVSGIFLTFFILHEIVEIVALWSLPPSDKTARIYQTSLTHPREMQILHNNAPLNNDFYRHMQFDAHILQLSETSIFALFGSSVSQFSFPKGLAQDVLKTQPTSDRGATLRKSEN